MRDHFVAVDVGTTSARAGIFTSDGRLLAKVRFPIRMQRGPGQHAEHSSEDIWSATCQAVKSASEEAGIGAEQVAAIGFDATCSLVVRDLEGGPLSISVVGDDEFDTVVWLDHRAIEQADRLSATGHPVLQYSGGSLSPEMQIPKLMWLKENMPDRWARIGYLFDLADFLTWRSTGSTARSQCTLTAKWNFLAHEREGWNGDFLRQAGLEDLLERGNLPPRAQPVGAAIGPLTPSAAAELGLDTGCLVAPGLIDAYAGALGALGAAANTGELGRNLALIGGTSSCLVAFSQAPLPGRSLWGPYFEAGYPGHWLVEGSQSATGALLDHVVRMHAAGGEPTSDLHDRIVRRIGELRSIEGSRFGDEIHILPDFHGNRSPLADPRATGVISGLTLDTSFDGLCRVYWRTCVAIMLGLRHILETMQGYGYVTDTLHLAGGHVNNPLLVELCADVTHCRVRVPATRDAVLLGSAMVAAVSAGLYADLAQAGAAMDQGGRVQMPDATRRAGYDRDYRRFLAMHRHRAELEAIL
ncbi:FGGY-family carbohydrate kinase [Rhizobium oryzicola]|uniref:FGGY-family carbohydrate kinase n=1 Tax=Rhizobium oryzicola TaxID=1232668 RepID=A0ABT8T0M4_9HYPH|nr:FGGY-family carbohydrate kinase [Rhizobium oryzicola]MDO1584304.1 FGGY-family carbohydrate kinase [Rhizobium oryzicola]